MHRSMKNAFGGIFEGMPVLVTGHTGFKGSWLALWLQELGAKVVGFSLPPPTDPSNFTVSRVADGMNSLQGDIRDYNAFREVLDRYHPQVIFHLAAQPIVLQSFENPKDTFDINVGGTVNVLEAARHCGSVKALVMVTSDKCYENREWIWGYRESDALGGHDPYSASKCMAEHAIASYRASFCGSKTRLQAIASARAGNVIGGGDFSNKRIVPDCMRALMAGEPVLVRNPMSVRPWLNVLDPLSGYLSLAAALVRKGIEFTGAWNFGPLEQQAVDVQALVTKSIELWGSGRWVAAEQQGDKQETSLLRLNWDKAANKLCWQPTYSWVEALQQTVEWFQAFDVHCRSPLSKDMREVCLNHLSAFTEKAEQRKKSNNMNGSK
jgi:CDP-glucose 4,6-dehydratase